MENAEKKETRVGFVGIIVEDRRAVADRVNHTISEYAHMVIARTGIPYREKNVSVITLVVDATTDEIGSLTGKLGVIPGVSVKSGLSKK